MNKKTRNPISWSPETAYAIGVITSDGCLSIDARHIEVTSKDKQMIRVLKECLSLKNRISKKSSGRNKNKKYYRVQWGDVRFYRQLLNIGLKPNKSKRLGEIKVPDLYFPDFLRGYFDGDGTCYSYWDKRWKNSFMFYVKLYSASEEFIKWLHHKIKRLTETRGSFNKLDKVYELEFAKKDSKTLFKKMYYKKNLPCLKRKYKRLKSYINREADVVESVDTAA